MGTPFDDIYDLAMMVITDYRLDYLYETDPGAFRNQFQGWLMKAISKFDGSLTSLDYDLERKSFNCELSHKEKDILAEYIVLLWFEMNLNDTTQVNLQLQGRDKKRNAESSNLKEKSNYFDRLREKVRQDITDYQLNNFDSFVF